MEHHAGLDVSLEETSVCIVDGAGKIIRETQVASEPEALVGYFSALEIKVVCIGLEAGPLSQWLHAALTEAGFEVVLLETRHVKAALSAMTVKTDRRDARVRNSFGWVGTGRCTARRSHLRRCGRSLRRAKPCWASSSISNLACAASYAGSD